MLRKYTVNWEKKILTFQIKNYNDNLYCTIQVDMSESRDKHDVFEVR